MDLILPNPTHDPHSDLVAGFLHKKIHAPPAWKSMSAVYSQYMEQNLLIVIGLLVFYILFSQIKEKRRRRIRAQAWRENDLSDMDNQMRFVSEASFNKKTIINREAYSVFVIIERFLLEKKRGYRVLPEVCLGAVLWCDETDADHKAFKSINSKRVDIGVIDKFGKLLLAIEYQGTGHWRGNAIARDAVKRVALEKAAVKLIEIFPEESPQEIQNKVSVALG